MLIIESNQIIVTHVSLGMLLVQTISCKYLKVIQIYTVVLGTFKPVISHLYQAFYKYLAKDMALIDMRTKFFAPNMNDMRDY